MAQFPNLENPFNKVYLPSADNSPPTHTLHFLLPVLNRSPATPHSDTSLPLTHHPVARPYHTRTYYRWAYHRD